MCVCVCTFIIIVSRIDEHLFGTPLPFPPPTNPKVIITLSLIKAYSMVAAH